MNVQDELKALKERIAELEELAKEEQEFPKMGDIYWRIDDRGSVDNCMYNNYYTDNHRQAIGNFYKTKEQAEFAAEKLKVEAELRNYSRKFIWGGENWILSMGTNKDIFLVYEDDEMNQGAVYFEDEYKSLEAIEAVGRERIKKYIFGVED